MPVPSTALMAALPRTLVRSIKDSCRNSEVNLATLRHGKRNDDRTLRRPGKRDGGDGVLYADRAPGNASVLHSRPSVESATGPRSNRPISSTAMPNAYIPALQREFPQKEDRLAPTPHFSTSFFLPRS